MILRRTPVTRCRTGLIIAALGLLLVCCNVFAAPSTVLPDDLHRADHIEGTFQQQRFISVLSTPLRSHGTFTFDREDGIVWRTLEPVESLVIVDPLDGIVAGESEDSLTRITSSRVVADIFLSLFSGDLSRLDNLFTISQQPASEGWSLHLEPASPQVAEQIASIRISGGRYVKEIRLEDANGDRSEIRLQVSAVE